MGRWLDICVDMPIKSAGLDLGFDARGSAGAPMSPIPGSGHNTYAPSKAITPDRSTLAQPPTGTQITQKVGQKNGGQLTGRLISTETASSNVPGLFIGSAVLTGQSVWVGAASHGPTSAKMSKNILHAGSKILQLHPVARAVGLAATGVVLAYERGWLDHFRPIAHEPKNIGATTHHRMPGPLRPAVEIETFGNQDQVRAFNEKDRKIATGGSMIPEQLRKSSAIEGYRITPEANQGLMLPGKQMLSTPQDTPRNRGYTSIDAPRFGENILWAKAHPDNNEKGTEPTDNGQARSGRDLTPYFVIKKNQTNDHGQRMHIVKYQPPSGVSAHFSGKVSPDGTLTYSIKADPLTRGGDLFLSAINALKQNKIEVYAIHNRWDAGWPYVDNKASFTKSLEAIRGDAQNLTLSEASTINAIAAANTFDGRMAKKLGYAPTFVKPSTPEAIFENPVAAKIRVMSELGPAFVKEFTHSPNARIGTDEVAAVARQIEVSFDEHAAKLVYSSETSSVAPTVLELDIRNKTLTWELTRSDKPTVDFLGTQVTAATVAGIVQRAQEVAGGTIEKVVLNVGYGSVADMGLRFLRDDASFPHEKAVNNIPVVRALKAIGFEPETKSERSFLWEPSITLLQDKSGS